MNKHANHIKQRLSLRQPLKESLDILSLLEKYLSLSKDADLKEELQTVQAIHPGVKDFERDFVSLCFHIATGVGKTRLMGAFIAYLYLERGIKNFFVLAPNLTIYEKLMEDFGNPGYSKYVFSGLGEFVHQKPLIITGENYNQVGSLFSNSEVRINIFNVAKFNADSKGSKKDGVNLAPRIKRLSEYLGQSYWDYLTSLQDLVILMDEAHRYHADSSKKAINELKPVLGLELTATPTDEKGNPFRNVVYEYSLARALEDGKYVKSPAIATRKNFRSHGMNPEEIERIKLEDAISIHLDTKAELEIYSKNTGAKRVKPFVLVVCRDIAHAKEVFQYINSSLFYGGAFVGKVLQIDSSTKKDEEIDRQFVELERVENEIEIVIHVNMLKEGWDVSNLYTIVPLRAANASILIEQTIGRGLRLPFNGERTGVDKLDKLTVIAHDNFEAVIAEAQNPNSVLNKMSFVQLDEDGFNPTLETVNSPSLVEAKFQREEKLIEQIQDQAKRTQAKFGLTARRAMIDILPQVGKMDSVKSAADLTKPEVKAYVIRQVQEVMSSGQLDAFMVGEMEKLESDYERLVSEYKNNIIEIPRISLTQDNPRAWFEDFDLFTDIGFDFIPLTEEILVVELTGERKVDTVGVQHGATIKDPPVHQIISELINYPEIDYDEVGELLYKLANQALAKIKEDNPDPAKFVLTVRQYRKKIAWQIYQQMRVNFRISEPEYIAPSVLPFQKINEWNFTTIPGGRRDYKEVITPVSLIPKLVFTGFKKAGHLEYKFDSKTEKDFAYILENDTSVLKWLRPAAGQFLIYWANNSKLYVPDFIIETTDAIYMAETKAKDQMNSAEVLDKKKAAETYCRYASEYTAANGGKRWKYLLIPHDEVGMERSFGWFLG
jgi:type III restriction enzyme